jgi:hypothetical protein
MYVVWIVLDRANRAHRQAPNDATVAWSRAALARQRAAVLFSSFVWAGGYMRGAARNGLMLFF